jgi:lysophospholipase L1-like esterase
MGLFQMPPRGLSAPFQQHTSARRIHRQLLDDAAYRDYTVSFRPLVSVARTYNAYLLQFAKSRHFLSCDIASQFAPSFDIFFDDTHFNENGARIAADAVLDCIQKQTH